MSNFLKGFFALLIIFSFYILFIDLGKSPLENWDEAWYGEIIKQMLLTRDFVVPHWNHTVLFDKPPMYMWIGVLFSSILGLSELAIRLPSALSAFVIVVIVLLYSYKKWGFIPAIIAYASLMFNNIYVWRARSGNIDAFVSLLIFATYFVMISSRKSRYLLLGILFACIYLTKASLVVFPLSIFIIHEIIYMRKQIKENLLEYLKLFLIFFFLSGIWLALGNISAGKDFAYYFLFKSDQGVATNIFPLHFKNDYLDYAYYSLQRRYYYIFIIGLVFLVTKIKDNRNLLILLFSTMMLVLLSFSQKNNNWYLLPSMPFWSLTIAFGTYQLLKLFHNTKLLTLPFLAIILYMSYKTFTVNIIPILDNHSTIFQAESSKMIQTLSDKNDIVVRLDHLYPSTIYYTDRKVLASPAGNTTTKAYWISREDIIKSIQEKKLKWILGTTTDVEQFIKENNTLPLEVIKANRAESIIKVN